MNRAHVAVITVCILLATTSFAQPRMEHRGRPDISGKRETMMDKLQLTDEQQIKMEKLRIGLQKKEAELQSKTRIARLDLKEFFISETPDRAAIEKTMKIISDLQYQKKLAHIDHLFAVREVLTPDQRKTWKKHMMESKHPRDGERPPMGGRRPMMGDGDDD